MSYRSFWVRRLAVAASLAPTAPVFADAPFVGSAFIGKPMELITGVLAEGTTGTITTEVINLAGDVLPSSYVIQQGDQLRFRQIATNDAGVDIHFSGWAYAVPEITGYTDLTPVVRSTSVALTSNAQPGSRLFYLSSSVGVAPAAGEFYFWDGAQIIDSTGSTTGAGGVAYGADWRNPSGPVKAWRHMAACLQTQAGLPPGIRSGDYGANAGIGTTQAGNPRIGYPDRWLFKRGDTFNLDTDYVDYKTYATGYTGTGVWLGMHGGADANNLQVCCDYGPSSSPRPRFIAPKNKGGTVSTNLSWPFIPAAGKHVRYVGLWLDGQTRDADFTGTLAIGFWNGYTADKINQGFEDIKLDGLGAGDLTANAGKNQVYFFRSVIVDTWAGTLNYGHIAGAKSSAFDPGRVQIVDCRIARNGYKMIKPGRIEGGTETPAAHNTSNAYSRDDVVLSGGEWYICTNAAAAGVAITNTTNWTKVSTDGGRRALGTVFDRNLYCSNVCDVYDSIILRGASGEQFRGGGYIYRNFFQAGYLMFAGFYDQEATPEQIAVVRNNVQQIVNQSNVHPGWGIRIQEGCRNSLFEGNLATGAGEEANNTALTLTARTRNEADNYFVANPTESNVVRNNLFAHGTANPAISLSDNLTAESTYTRQLVGNKIASNDFVGSGPIAPVYAAAGLAPFSTDTVTTGNTAYATRAAYAEAKGGVDPSRTLKTYLQSLGITVNSIDGVHEFVEIVKTMDRNNWPAQYSAAAINDYIRTGLGFTIPA